MTEVKPIPCEKVEPTIDKTNEPTDETKLYEEYKLMRHRYFETLRLCEGPSYQRYLDTAYEEMKKVYNNLTEKQRFQEGPLEKLYRIPDPHGYGESRMMDMFNFRW